MQESKRLHRKDVIMKRTLAGGLLVSMLLGAPVFAEQPWHELSGRVFAGSVFNAASIDARDGYNSVDLGSELEWGGALSLTPDNTYEFELAYMQWSTDGHQYKYPGADKIKVDVNVKQASFSYRRKYAYPGVVVPWWGAGPDIAYVETHELETVNGANKPQVDQTHTGFGLHLCGGMDIYPVKYSALALTLEARYSYYFVGNSFPGDINGLAAVVGLRWDFWQHSNLD